VEGSADYFLMRERVAFFTSHCTGRLLVTLKFWRSAALKNRAGIGSVGVGVREGSNRMPACATLGAGWFADDRGSQPQGTGAARSERGPQKGHRGGYIRYADLSRVPGKEGDGAAQPVSHPAVHRTGATHSLEADHQADAEATSSAWGR
jgi:hypothetical protein